MAKVKRQRKIVAIVGLLALLILAAVVVVTVLRSQVKANAVFTIDGRAYSDKEVKEIINFATENGEPANQAAREAFGYLKRQHVAQDLSIKVSQKDINAKRNEIFGSSKKIKNSQWTNLVAYNDALIGSLDKLAENANINGYVYVFFFGQQIERGPAYTPPHYGDKNIINRDRAYANKQANIYHRQLANGNLSPKEAFKKIEADAKIGWFNKTNSNPSGYFMGSNLVGKPDSLPADVVDYLNSSDIKKGLSNIKIGRTPVNSTIQKPDTNSTQETYYYFVLVQNLNKSQSKSNFNNKLQNLPVHFNGFKKGNK